MSDEPNINDGPVLRPFDAPDADPLPPVEPSKVVPESVVIDDSSEVSEISAIDDPVDNWLPADLGLDDGPPSALFTDFSGDTPQTEIDGRPVVARVPTPPDTPDRVDPFAAVAAGFDGPPSEYAGESAEDSADAEPVPAPVEAAADEPAEAPAEPLSFEPEVIAPEELIKPREDAPLEPVFVAADLPEPSDGLDDADSDADAEVAATVAAAAPGAWPANSSLGDDKIVLSRKGFLIGLGAVALAIAGLFALWQTSGDDGAETVAGPPEVTETLAADPTTPVDDVDTTVDEDDGAAEVDNDLADRLADAQAEVVGLRSEVDALAERPAPAIPGNRVRRIVVSADAKFVSAFDGSVAVVGAFGGLSIIDPEINRVISGGPVADAATRVLRTSSSVWITNYAGNEILQVDPVTATVVARFAFLGPDGIEKDGDTLIVASFDGNLVSRVNPGSGEAMQTVDVGGSPTDVISHPDHGLWVAVFSTGELVQIDPATFTVINRVTVGQGPVGISADATHLWVANHDDGTIAKVDPGTAELVEQIAVGQGPTELVVTGGSVWATVTDDGDLVQVDVNNGSIVTRTPLGGAVAGGGPTGISFGSDAIWVAMQGEQSVVRVDL